MFKYFTINMSGPICNCKVQDLGWGTEPGSLLIRCNTCKVQLNVPDGAQKAYWQFDIPYPDGKKAKAPIISIVRESIEEPK